MKKVVIAINGESGSGKDTFVNMCTRYVKNKTNDIPVFNLHRSDESKQILKRLGWDGIRTPEVRKLLADLVDFGENTGHNEKELFKTIDMLGGIIFYHSRDPKNIEQIKKHYWFQENIQVITLLVLRGQNIASEKDRWGIEDYKYDKAIFNYYDFEHLNLLAEIFMGDVLNDMEVETWE